MLSNFWEVDEEGLYRQIYKKFNKTKEDINEDINILSQWAKTQPHFPEEPSVKLLRYVLGRNKFSIEEAKIKLDMYYTIRSLVPEFYRSQPLLPELVLQRRVFYCVPLPKPTTPDIRRIFYTQINPNFGPAFFNFERFVENFCNLGELIIQEDKCYSFDYIVDFAGAQLGHVSKFNPMVLRKALVVFEKVYSNRVAAIYLVNVSKFVETFINNVIMPLLQQKIRDRTSFHTGTDILIQKYGKNVMPKDIGGEERSLDELTDYILREYEAKEGRFQSLRALRVDENLRPQKLVNDDILGYHGNFKKLNVD